jgi:hypothetical protein
MDKKSSILWYYILVASFSIKISDALSECPTGWITRNKYNGNKDISRCYNVFKVNESLTTSKGQLACFSNDAHLAKIEDQDDLNFVSSYLLKVNGNNPYYAILASLENC